MRSEVAKNNITKSLLPPHQPGPHGCYRSLTARVSAGFSPLAEIGVVVDGRGAPQQPEPHLTIAVAASWKLLSFKQGSFVTHAMSRMRH